jgi:O-antigen/teichoic acid export membrane protein
MVELPPANRFSFLLANYALALLPLPFLVGFVIAVPDVPRLLIGPTADLPVLFHLILFTPAILLYFIATSALRGLMDTLFAQLLTRLVSVVTLLVYSYLLVFHAQSFRQHYSLFVFLPYIAILLGASAVACFRLSGHLTFTTRWTLEGALPGGFWVFALAMYASSALTFLNQRLDQILVARQLGVSTLGVYYLLLQLAEAPALLAGYLLEAITPAILAVAAAPRVQELHGLYDKAARYILLIKSVVGLVLITVASHLLPLLGSPYRSALPALLILFVSSSAASLVPLQNVLIAGLGKTNLSIIVQIARLATLPLLFGLLAPSGGLPGIALARGTASSLAALSLLCLVSRHARTPTQYLPHVAITVTTALAVYLLGESPSLPASLSICVAGVSAFLLLGRYTVAELLECLALLRARHPTPSSHTMRSQMPPSGTPTPTATLSSPPTSSV